MTCSTQTIPPRSESERLAAVRRYDILDTPPDGSFDRVTRLAARFFHVPISTISIVDHDRIWFKSHHGLEAEEIPRELGLCASAILQPDPWVITDAELDPRTLTNSLVRGQLGLRFYAAAPLTTRDGHNLGTLNVIDTKPRQVTAGEIDTLQDLAAIVVDELEIRLTARGEQQRLNYERADFVITAAHELRTPLAAVYGAAKLLTQANLGKGSRDKLLTVIAQESERLAAVVGDILTGAQIESGRIRIATEHFNPLTLIQTSIEAARVNLPTNLKLELHSPDRLPELISDPDKVKQILAGLIDNAVKYSPNGGQITIAAEPREHGVRLSVSDQGIGIPEAERERIFEKFTRLDSATASAVGGTGLGLYIARELARALGGWITCEPGQPGSTFAFELPATAPTGGRKTAEAVPPTDTTPPAR